MIYSLQCDRRPPGGSTYHTNTWRLLSESKRLWSRFDFIIGDRVHQNLIFVSVTFIVSGFLTKISLNFVLVVSTVHMREELPLINLTSSIRLLSCWDWWLKQMPPYCLHVLLPVICHKVRLYVQLILTCYMCVYSDFWLKTNAHIWLEVLTLSA